MLIRSSIFVIKLLACLLFGSFGVISSAFSESWQDSVYAHGFYTLDFTYSDNELGLVSNDSQARSYEDDAAGINNSVFGGQVEVLLSDNLSSFFQGKAFFDDEDEAETTLDWAYLSYDLGDDITLRGGKFLVPLLQGTELRSISYSRLWARPLIPITGANGFNEYTGIELLKHIQQSSGSWHLQLSTGKPNHEDEDGEIESKNLQLLSARYQGDNFWIRAAALHGNYTVRDGDDEILDDSAAVVMGSLESEFTLGSFVFNMGYAASDSDITVNGSIYYASLGLRMGHITPFIYGSLSREHYDNYNEPPPPGFNDGNGPDLPDPAPPPPGEEDDDDRIRDGDYDINSVAIGVRWHATESYGFKIQWENIEQRNSAGVDTDNPTNDGNTFTILFEGVF